MKQEIEIGGVVSLCLFTSAVSVIVFNVLPFPVDGLTAGMVLLMFSLLSVWVGDM